MISAICALVVSMTMIVSCGGPEPDTPDPIPQPQPSKVSVTGVSLNKTTLTLDEGGSETLTATVAPSNATDKGVSWKSSDSGVASVDNNGKVTAVAPGTVTITAVTKDDSKSATCEVTVTPKPIPVESVTIKKKALELVKGEDTLLVATVTPKNASDKSLEWSSSDESVATVDEEGRVTAVGAGTATITVTTKDGGKTAFCEVTVVVNVESVSIDKKTLELAVGEEAALVATLAPEDASYKVVEWRSSDIYVATVDEEGKVTAVGAGTATITVTSRDNGMTASCEVTVQGKEVKVEKLEMSQEAVTVKAFWQETVFVRIYPQNADDQTVTWISTDESVAWPKPRQNQPITCDIQTVNPGEAIIIAVSGDGTKTAQCKVTVTPIPLEFIQLASSSIRVYIGQTLTYDVLYMPSNATNKKVKWSVADPSIASVDQNGVITGKAQGQTKIIAVAEDGGITAEREVWVWPVEVRVTSIKLDKTSLTMTAGTEETLTATLSPENATTKDVRWVSSDYNVATVSSEGVVRAQNAGTATITAISEDGFYKATCKVTVGASAAGQVTGVRMSSSEISLTVGGTTTLYAYVSPSTAANQGVTWSSSDPSVVKVDNRGNLTAVKLGTAVITAKTNDGGYTAKCTVKVQTQVVHPQKVTLDKSIVTLDIDSKLQLNATISPSNATNPSIAWKSENESIAKVSASGLVTAVGTGTTKIIAYAVDNGSAASCMVSVKKFIRRISISGPTSVPVFSYIRLTANITPTDPSNKNIIWSSSNNSIASVDQSGSVHGLKEGKVTITAAADDEGGVVGTYQVTVTKAAVTYIMWNDYYVESGQDLEMLAGEYRSFGVTLYPKELQPNVTWSSSNTQIVEIQDYQGKKYERLLHAKKAGTCTITVQVQDGNATKRSFKVVVRDQ